jgi:hypothetical protein
MTPPLIALAALAGGGATVYAGIAVEFLIKKRRR